MEQRVCEELARLHPPHLHRTQTQQEETAPHLKTITYLYKITVSSYFKDATSCEGSRIVPHHLLKPTT